MTASFEDFRPLWPYVRPYRRALGLGVVCLALASGFQLAWPLVLRSGIDALRSSGAAAALPRHAWALVALAALQAAFKFASRRIFLGGARRVEHDVRARYVAHLIRLPAARIEEARKGDLLSRATHDLQDVRLFLGPGALNFLQTLVLLLTATVLLANIHGPLTLAALAPFPAISVMVRRYAPRLHRRYLEANRKAGDLSALVQEGLAGMRVVRSYHREAWQAERFEAANAAARTAQMEVVRAWILLFPMVGVVAGLGHIAVLGLGGALVSRGSLTLGEFVAFNTYLAMLTWPMVALGWTLSLVQRGAAALARLQEVFRLSPDPPGSEALAEAHAVCLEAKAVGFAYGSAADPVLEQVDLVLPEGGYWGLVGETASGKSTLVALLSRLRRPDRGRVEVHGRDLATVAAAELRTHVATVPQEGFFFADTVANNVCLGRPRRDDRLAWALEVAGLAAEVAAMPQGAESLVGEGGVTLSGGQRQRLALARALYGRPGTLLLDSALSSLDTETARRVLAGVRRALPKTSLLVVSHRGTEVDDADGVFFLRNGRIAARGPHAALLRTVPEYLRLYREEELRRELEEGVG
ncbi:MAG: ABC transporter ATP-binding protein [Deferrisomatales bacterium]